MAAWKKRFAKWETVRAPTPKSEVEPLLRRVFGDRLRYPQGTSHAFIVDVSELRDEPEFAHGILGFPVRGGQQIIGVYLRLAFQAAVKLGLLDQEEADAEEEEAEEEENHDTEQSSIP